MEDFGGSSQTIQYHFRYKNHLPWAVRCWLFGIRSSKTKRMLEGKHQRSSTEGLAWEIFLKRERLRNPWICNEDVYMILGYLGSQNRVSAACLFHEPWTDKRICLPWRCDHEDVQLLFWCWMSVSNKWCFASKLNSVLSELAEKYILAWWARVSGSAVWHPQMFIWFCQISGWINLEASPKKSMSMKSLGNLRTEPGIVWLIPKYLTYVSVTWKV